MPPKGVLRRVTRDEAYRVRGVPEQSARARALGRGLPRPRFYEDLPERVYDRAPPLVHPALDMLDITPLYERVEGMYFRTIDQDLLANQVLRVPVQVGVDGDFVIPMMSAVSTGIFDVRFSDGATGVAYTDGPVRNTLLFGTNLLQSRMPFPMYLMGNSSAFFELADASGAPNNVRITLAGGRLLVDTGEEDLGWRHPWIPFYQPVGVNGVVVVGAGIGTRVQVVVPIDGDADLLLCAWTSEQTGIYDVEFSVQAEGFSMQDAPLASATIAGTGAQPYEFPFRQPVPRKSSLIVTYTNQIAGANTIRGCLWNVKSYPRIDFRTPR